MNSAITASDVMSMIEHWLKTPQDAYLGSSYGNNLREVLQSPLSAGLANKQIKKMIEDIPILSVFPEGSINIYSVAQSPDKTYIMIDVMGNTFSFAG